MQKLARWAKYTGTVADAPPLGNAASPTVCCNFGFGGRGEGCAWLVTPSDGISDEESKRAESNTDSGWSCSRLQTLRKAAPTCESPQSLGSSNVDCDGQAERVSGSGRATRCGIDTRPPETLWSRFGGKGRVMVLRKVEGSCRVCMHTCMYVCMYTRQNRGAEQV